MPQTLYQLEAKLSGSLLNSVAKEIFTAQMQFSFVNSDDNTSRVPDPDTKLFEFDPSNTQTDKKSEYILCESHSTTNGITTLVNVTRGLNRDGTTNLVADIDRASAWDAGTIAAVVTEPFNINLMRKYFSGVVRVLDKMLLSDINVDETIEFEDGDVTIRRDGDDMKLKDLNQSEVTLSELAAAAGTDEKVKATVNDTTSSYLDDKLTVGTNLTKTLLNPGANEQIRIDLDAFGIDYTLGENLAAAAVVKIYNDAGTAKVEGMKTESIGTVATFTTFEIGNVVACKIAEDKVMIAFHELDDGFDIRAIVGTISGNTITFGTSVVIDAVNIPANSPLSCAPLGTDKFIVGWADGNNTRGECRVGTVVGTAITLGAVAAFDTSDEPQDLGLTQLGTDKFALSWKQGTTDDLETRVGTVAGTAITYGTTVTVVSTGVSISNNQCIAKLDTDKYVMTWVKSSQGRFVIATVSGTTVTLKTISQVVTTTSSFFSVSELTTNTVIFGHLSDSGSIFMLGYAEDSNFSFAGETRIGDGSSLIRYFRAIGDNRFVAVNANGDYYVQCFIREGQIEVYPPISFTANDAITFAFVTASNSNGKFVVGGSNTGATQGDAYAVTPSNFDQAAGVLQTGGNSGDVREVRIQGEKSPVHAFSASDVGKVLYIQPDGSLGTAFTTFDFGRILSTTTMTIF